MSLAVSHPQELKDLLELLQSKGVSRFVLGPLEIHFAAGEEPKDLSDAVPKGLTLGGPEMCACGHDETEHGQGGLCLRACDAAACNPENKS